MFLPPVRPSDGESPTISVSLHEPGSDSAGASVTLEESSYKYLQIRDNPAYCEARLAAARRGEGRARAGSRAVC